MRLHSYFYNRKGCMCGIAGYTRLTDKPFDKADKFCTELLMGIQDRGRDATGFVAINDNGDVALQKASCSAFYFNKHRMRIPDDARTVLLHTRFATQGKPAFPENNHPVECGGIYAVHNGHIWNDDAVERDSLFSRSGEVDSWAIPALVAEKGWDNCPASLEFLDGDMAVALINVHSPKDVIVARGNGNPVVILKTEHLLVWASYTSAIRSAWGKTLGTPPDFKRYDYLEDGESYVVKDGEVSEVEFTPGFTYVYTRNSGYYKGPSSSADKWDWSDDYEIKILDDGKKVYIPKDDTYDSCSVETKGMEMERYEGTVEAVAAKLLDGAWSLDEDELSMEEIIGSGLDVMKCDDCGEWFETKEITTTYIYGIKSDLCDMCKEWAIREMSEAEIGLQ